jgi:hypothetical protein
MRRTNSGRLSHMQPSHNFLSLCGSTAQLKVVMAAPPPRDMEKKHMTAKNGTTAIEYDDTAAQRARDARFKSTGEPSEYPRVAGDEAVAERAALSKSNDGKSKAGAFDSLEAAAASCKK